MYIRVIGDSDVARATRLALRLSGFAVVEIIPAAIVAAMPYGGFVFTIEEHDGGQIVVDSIDCPLERCILSHLTQLHGAPVVLDRPGGQVHSDRELRLLVPRGGQVDGRAIAYAISRGLTDLVDEKRPRPAAFRKSFWQRLFGESQ